MRRSTVVFLSRAALLTLALVGTACDNGPDIGPTPPPVLVTETFTGTVTLNGAISHSFNATTAGTTTATITALDPSGAFIGFQMGTWSGVVCTAVLSNEAGTAVERAGGGHPIGGQPVRQGARPERHPDRQAGHLHRYGHPPVTVGSRQSSVASLQSTVSSRRSESSVLVQFQPRGRSYSSITSSRRRLGRRRPTPRLDDRMKCRRYSTSTQPSDGSRSICASARLVFECRR